MTVLVNKKIKDCKVSCTGNLRVKFEVCRFNRFEAISISLL